MIHMKYLLLTWKRCNLIYFHADIKYIYTLIPKYPNAKIAKFLKVDLIQLKTQTASFLELQNVQLYQICYLFY